MSMPVILPILGFLIVLFTLSIIVKRLRGRIRKHELLINNEILNSDNLSESINSDTDLSQLIKIIETVESSKIIPAYIELKLKSENNFNFFKSKLKKAFLDAFKDNNIDQIWRYSIIIGQLDNLNFTFEECQFLESKFLNIPEIKLTPFYDDRHDKRKYVRLAIEILNNYISQQKCRCDFYNYNLKMNYCKYQLNVNIFTPLYEIQLGYLSPLNKERYIDYERYYSEEYYKCNLCISEVYYGVQEGGHAPHTFLAKGFLPMS